MNRILVIGQAPARKEQKVPYDTTMLYIMLEWCGITKEQAQDIFEFDALTDKFPGVVNGNHNKPAQEAVDAYYELVLQNKINMHQRIILLGKQAQLYLVDKIPGDKKVVLLIHPSRRNYSKIMAAKDEIILRLKSIL